MAQPFDASNAAVDRPSLEELGIVRNALDIGYFRPGQTIVARDRAPEGLFIVIKGSGEACDHDEVGPRGPGDAFDSRPLAQGEAPTPMPSSLAGRRYATCRPAT
jgi:CBS domain-containing protein